MASSDHTNKGERQKGEGTVASYTKTLIEISQQITDDNLSELKFACKDIIPDGRRENITNARDLFHELEKRGELSLDKLDVLVCLLERIGLRNLARQILKASKAGFGDDQNVEKVNALIKQARVSLKEGKHIQVCHLYDEALSLLSRCPKNTETTQQLSSKILRNRADCYNQQKKFVDSIADCSEVLKQDPEDLLAKFLLAQAYFGLEQFVEAKKELHILAKAKPKDPDVLSLYNAVQARVKTEQHEKLTSSLSDEVDNKFLGDAYPRKIILVCDKWSGWHRDIYNVNRHLCRSFAKMNGVQVACLVLEASDKDKIKAGKDGVVLFTCSDRSGIPDGDHRLFCMHDDFPFKPDIVVGHGMVTGAESADLARKFECKYLQIFYDVPCCASVETETELGKAADFVAAIGPHLAREWRNILNCEVIEIIPGFPSPNPRNSLPTLHNRCLIVESMSENRDNGLPFAVEALNDCKKRGKPVQITIQGTPPSRKADLQQNCEGKLNSSNFKVSVMSHEASIETVEGEVRAVSLLMMPAQSECFGIRCLEALGSGVPVLISISFGFADVLLKYFDEKFWRFLCSVEDKDDYEKWSDRIDAFLDERDKYFALASELQHEWNKKFSWDSAASKVLDHLSTSDQFSKIVSEKDKESSSPSLCPIRVPSVARKFVDELELNDRRRKFILIVSPADNLTASSVCQHLAKVPWIAVFDFDVQSEDSGYLQHCESLSNKMGLKICRIISPPPNEESRKVTLANGTPWFLLEGTADSERNMSNSLVWLKNVVFTLEKKHHAPMTILILWKAYEENKCLTRKLGKLLNIIEASSLKKQVKLALVLTDGQQQFFLEGIEDDWNTIIHSLSLEDVCNAINETLTENPLVNESLNFTIPVADQGGNATGQTKVLPVELRWINAELEVIYQSVGDNPVHGIKDAQHFYRGGTISWYALNMGHAIERDSWKPIKAMIDGLLPTAGTLRRKLPHRRGTGGTTSARKMLFDYHRTYPCVTVNSISHTETASAIQVLSDFCKLPVIVLVDCKHVQGEEFHLEMLYNRLSNSRVPCLILEVVHLHQNKSIKLKKEALCAATTLNRAERTNFVTIYSDQKKNRVPQLRQLQRDQKEELQIPFYYALVTYEETFNALEPFIEDCLANSDKDQRQILIFLAMAHHYGHVPVPEAILISFVNAPNGTVLDDVLTGPSINLLIEEDGNWRPRHDLIGSKVLQKLLALGIHQDNWIQNVAIEAINFIMHMSERLVSELLMTRITEFSPLINDIPDDADAIRVFEKAIDLFPDNPFFKVHLGRLYSIKKEHPGLEMAIKYTDAAIECADSDMSRVVRGQFAQMKGIVYSRHVGYLIKDGVEINDLVMYAQEGVKWFRRSVSVCPDTVDGYIPEVIMMCKIFEYLDKKSGNLYDYLKQETCNQFFIDEVSQTSDTLESVPDHDQYSRWKTRLLNLGLYKNVKMVETIGLLEQLRESGRARRGPINRKIADMRMELCEKNKTSLSTVASDVNKLLLEALKYDVKEKEPTMRLWVRIAPYVPVALHDAETLIYKWCSEEKSALSFLYKYIIACIQVLEGSKHHCERMKTIFQDLTKAVKAQNRDVGRVRLPVIPVAWLGPESKGMGQLVYFSDTQKQKRPANSLLHEQTKKLRKLSGTITDIQPKVGKISVKGVLDVTFRKDLCDPPFTSAVVCHKNVQFYLGFTYFGVQAYNIKLMN